MWISPAEIMCIWYLTKYRPLRLFALFVNNEIEVSYFCQTWEIVEQTRKMHVQSQQYNHKINFWHVFEPNNKITSFRGVKSLNI